MDNLLEKIKPLLAVITWRRAALVLAVVVAFFSICDLAVMPLYTRQYQAITVPDVMHHTFGEAEKILQRSGLRVVKDGEKFDETLAAGKIVFQNPEASATVKKGRRVYVSLSKGGRTFAMPKLIGLALRDVRFIVQDNELSLGYIAYRNDPFLPDGVVCEQSPAEGSTVGVHERVDISISLGVEPTEFIVPELVGKSEEDAVLAIQKAGLTLGEINRQAAEELLPNTVISQSLQAGLQVAKGDTLNIVVSILP
jgi:eukaryotic-like serine/threonine-protein kinase